MDVPVTDPAPVAALREDLSGFTVDAVTQLLGPVAHAALSREQPVPAVSVLAAVAAGGGPREPLATLVTAWVVGRPVRRRRLQEALPRLGADGAVRLGLAEAAGEGPDDELRPRVDLRPYAAVDAVGAADWWVVSDLDQLAAGAPLRTDHVLGVGGASTTLARCALRRPVGRVLDLGTGCGVQALHATRHAVHVTGTDLSRRALSFARFTLALNGLTPRRTPDGRGFPAGADTDGTATDGAGPDGRGRRRARIELRHGDLFGPVTGERFDQVVSNPPFVITPRRPGVPSYEYRDGGRVGDDLVRDVVTGIGAVLSEGGTAQVLGNWEHRRGQAWTDRVGGWLDEAGLDGWVIQREVQDPAEYAELWIRDGGRPDPHTYDALYRAWLEDFASRDVEAVGFGLLVLRRPWSSAVTLRRFEDLRGGGDRPLGEHLAACLDAHDWLTSTDDTALLAARLVTGPDVTEERYHRPGEPDPQVVLLRQGGGFGRAVRADTALAGFVGACDGDLPAGRLIAALAGLLDVPVADLTAELLPAVRALIAEGLVRRPAP